jgi:hypothetical protein
VWLLLPLAVLLISLTNHLVLSALRTANEPESSVVDSLLYSLAVLLLNMTTMEYRLKNYLASRVIN